jgi:hypothetical protein
MILLRPRAFAVEMSRPVRVSALDARAFRRITLRLVLLAYLLAVTAAAAYGLRAMTRTGALPPTELLMPAVAASALGTLIGALGMLIATGLGTDLPTFIWRGLPANPDDLAPLHHYACAPLALVPLLALLCIAALAALDSFGGDELELAVRIFITALVMVVAAMIWWIPPVLMRAATRCSMGRLLALAAYLPVHWAMMLFIGAMVGLIGVIISANALKALQ